jgi:hypothetical protein
MRTSEFGCFVKNNCGTSLIDDMFMPYEC